LVIHANIQTGNIKESDSWETKGKWGDDMKMYLKGIGYGIVDFIEVSQAWYCNYCIEYLISLKDWEFLYQLSLKQDFIIIIIILKNLII
jgi:hypothetical protein